MPTITVRLSNESYNMWDLHTKVKGEFPSTAVREMIEAELQANYQTKANTARKPRREETKRQVFLRLTESEIVAIDKRVKLLGKSRNSWIVSAVRVALTGKPELNDKEIACLSEASYELSKLNSGLSAMLKSIKQKDISDATVEKLASRIGNIEEKIKPVEKEMNSLIDSNLHRWAIK